MRWGGVTIEWNRTMIHTHRARMNEKKRNHELYVSQNTKNKNQEQMNNK